MHWQRESLLREDFRVFSHVQRMYEL
jgi:hypothetical protein